MWVKPSSRFSVRTRDIQSSSSVAASVDVRRCPPRLLTFEQTPRNPLPPVTYVAVDYSDPAALVLVLEQHEVDTVISCLMTTNQTIADAQLAAIDAADKSPCTQRFIVSNWGPPTLPEYGRTNPHMTSSSIADVV